MRHVIAFVLLAMATPAAGQNFAEHARPDSAAIAASHDQLRALLTEAGDRGWYLRISGAGQEFVGHYPRLHEHGVEFAEARLPFAYVESVERGTRHDRVIRIASLIGAAAGTYLGLTRFWPDCEDNCYTLWRASAGGTAGLIGGTLIGLAFTPNHTSWDLVWRRPAD